MKKISVLFIILCLIFSGCEKSIKKEGITFVDDLKREVTVSSFGRTAALLGSFADMWMLAGGEVIATADDAWIDFNLDLKEDCVNLGKTKNLSLEKLISANPDFIIASTNTKQHIEWLDTFESLNIPVAYFDVADFNDYLRTLEIMTDITKRDDLYEKNGLQIKKRVDDIIKRAKEKDSLKKTALFLRASGTFIRAKNSEGTVFGTMLKELGVINIADSDEGLLENLSLESIIKFNPDYIFIVPAGDNFKETKENVENMFKENPAWLSLDAIKNNRVHYMDKMLFNLKPNARWGEAYERLEEILF